MLFAEDFKVIDSEHIEALKRNWPQLHQWSYMINDSLKTMDAPQGDRTDPAYNRLRDAAFAIARARQDVAEAKQKAA